MKASLSGSSCSDYLAFIRAVLGWQRVQREGDRKDRDEYLDRLSLSRFSLRFIKGRSADIIICRDLTPHFTQIPSCRFDVGLISQFSTNLYEAELVPHANDCQHDTSLCNEYSDEEELLKAVLLAGLYPNLIQVEGIVNVHIFVLLKRIDFFCGLAVTRLLSESKAPMTLQNIDGKLHFLLLR